MSPPGPVRLVLLSKPGCHLCATLRAVAERVLPAFEAVLEERDVRSDAELLARYALEIPVLLMGEREVLRHHASESDLRARLRELRVPER